MRVAVEDDDQGHDRSRRVLSARSERISDTPARARGKLGQVVQIPTEKTTVVLLEHLQDVTPERRAAEERAPLREIHRDVAAVLGFEHVGENGGLFEVPRTLRGEFGNHVPHALDMFVVLDQELGLRAD